MTGTRRLDAGARAPAPREQLLHERDAAAMLAVSPTTLATWRSRRRYNLRWVRVGGGRAVRYRLSDVLAFIESGVVGGEGLGGGS